MLAHIIYKPLNRFDLPSVECLLLLTQFDSEGITVRKVDYRLITEKGRNKFENLAG